MGTIGVKIKIMPTSPEVNLDEIKEKIRALIKDCKFEEVPIAFGLKAIIILFAWPEDKELGKLEEEIKQIENISSIQVMDIRKID